MTTSKQVWRRQPSWPSTSLHEQCQLATQKIGLGTELGNRRFVGVFRQRHKRRRGRCEENRPQALDVTPRQALAKGSHDRYLIGKGAEEIWHALAKTAKSGVRVKRVRVAGRLKDLLGRIRARAVVGKTILCDERGQQLKATGTFRVRFYRARDAAGARIRELLSQNGEAWLNENGLPVPPPPPPPGKRDNWLKHLIQFRDMRPKAATDSERRDGMPATRKRLGHTTEAQTAGYVRDLIGELVDPGVIERPAFLAKVLSPKTGTRNVQNLGRSVHSAAL